MADHTWKGKLSRGDIGPGIWILDTGDRRYQLTGRIPQDLRGKQVRVRGTETSTFGFGMAGPTIEVQSIEGVS